MSEFKLRLTDCNVGVLTGRPPHRMELTLSFGFGTSFWRGNVLEAGGQRLLPLSVKAAGRGLS